MARKIVVFITLVASSMPFIALSGIIDGIAYIKIMVALICVMPLIPFMLKKIFETKDGNVLRPLAVSLLILVLFSILLFKNDYRGIFGAPGRSNGTLSILLYLCFTIFGIYVYIKNSISIILHGLVVASSLTFLISILHLISSKFNLFPVLDFSSSQFRDNVDSLAPLASMAFTSSLILYQKSRKIFYLILQVPAVYFVIKWQLLQPVVSFMLSVILILLKEKYIQWRLRACVPVAILAGYILAIIVLPLTPLLIDSSIVERLKIIRYTKEIWNHFSLFPIHIDALSDFSSSFKVPSQYLDDFHNVYLQLLFSFGLIIGIALIVLIISPFLQSTQQFDKTFIVFPVYFNFFIGLFFAIASPSFMYFGFIFIGYILGGTLFDRDRQIQTKKAKFGENFIFYLAVSLALTLQINDFAKRLDISTAVRAYSQGHSDNKYFDKLVGKVSGIRDAEYKFQVSRNFYLIGKCTYGNLVFEQLISINARDVRNVQLVELRKSCEQR